MTVTFGLLSFLFWGLPALSAEKGEILINVEGIKAAQSGQLIIALFAEEDSWPKHDSALSRKKIAVTGTSAQVRLEAVDSETDYAVQVLHDKNSNGKLDFRWFPYPKPAEGVGVSNNNRRIGPPSFEKALFRIDGKKTTITIQLSY
ncbi:MAG TPA: DUF2141 domain-containing protein [Geopsychrobacteraceae bacterium]|nr:DUF2141 domain-containing protein [Geopsychrobacteraceae bacterium]